MLDQPSFERELNAYLVNVDGVLKGKGLLNDKGSAKLNSVQQEVDMTRQNEDYATRTSLLKSFSRSDGQC